jgi:hypothetical protein
MSIRCLRANHNPWKRSAYDVYVQITTLGSVPVPVVSDVALPLPLPCLFGDEAAEFA